MASRSDGEIADSLMRQLVSEMWVTVTDEGTLSDGEGTTLDLSEDELAYLRRIEPDWIRG